MKFYKITDLKQIARDQKYKLAALANSDGIRKHPYNSLKKKIEIHLTDINKRLNSDIMPDGIYYVLMSQSINSTRDPDKYAIKKGKVTSEDIQGTPAPILQENKSNEVLTYESALGYQQKISDLNLELAKKELLLQDALKKLDEFEELDEENELSEANNTTQNSLTSGLKFLGEQMPMLIPYLDKHFELEEKKLDLEKLKLEKVQKPITKATPTKERIEIVTGSQKHLDLIESLYNSSDEKRLNNELDKLQAFDIDLYNNVCKMLNLEEEEEEQETK